MLNFLQQLVSTAPALSAPLASLLAALAFILVFFVGLVIDLLPFYAQSLEVVALERELRRIVTGYVLCLRGTAFFSGPM